MAHSLVSNRVHIIFGTAGRAHTIPAERRTEVWQEKHHAKRDFQQELREFARKNGIDLE